MTRNSWPSDVKLFELCPELVEAESSHFLQPFAKGKWVIPLLALGAVFFFGELLRFFTGTEYFYRLMKRLTFFRELFILAVVPFIVVTPTDLLHEVTGHLFRSR